MWKVFAAGLAALLLFATKSLAEEADAPKRTLPHQEECATPLPTDFWNDPSAKSFEEAEAWAWNQRICLGHWADMRYAPGGSGHGEACQPGDIQNKGKAVPAYRQLRPVFLELILSHEPWASAPRHPQVFFRCALVRGDFDLDDHVIAPSFGFHQSKIDGEVSLVGTKFKRTLSLLGSSVTGKLNAVRLEVGGDLLLRDGGTFADIDLLRARIGGNAAFSGSTVAGELNADGLEVEGTLFLHDGGKFSDIYLLGAKIAGDAAFVGSTVTGVLAADGLEVGGSLFLRDGGSFADIRLLGARVSINAEFNGSTVAGLLNADGLEVGGNLFLRDGGSFSGIDLPGAKIGRNAEFNGSTLAGRLNADRLDVGGDLLLRDGGTFTDINLRGARIAGNMELDGSSVTGKLNSPGLDVGGYLYLRNRGTFSDIGLLGARIAGDVQLSGGVFGGEFDLTGAAIGGELHLSSGQLGPSPTWQNGASLILRNARADALQAPGDSWTVSGSDDLLQTDLTGFAYNRLEGLDTASGASMGDESAEWLIGWIEAQRDHGDNYDPQPYTQLAQVLDAAGATDKAEEVRYARFEHKRAHDESMSTGRRIWLEIERWVLGYGVYPIRVLYWFLGLVGLGWLFAQFSREPAVRRWTGLWYSFENALPLIETNRSFRDVEHGRHWLRHIFHVQKALGFLLATLLVGALTLLGG